MAPDRPTASVSGRQDWQWNRWRSDREPASDHARGPSPGTPRIRDQHRDHGDPSALRREIHDLEAELERTERRLQSVIDRYERIVAEKNRRLEAQSNDDPDGNTFGFVRDLLRR